MKFLSILFLVVCFGNVFSQKEITWKDLDCEFEEVWSEEYSAVYLEPLFEDKHLVLDSVNVKIKGKLLKVEADGTMYILSESIFDIHNFRGGADEVIQVEASSISDNIARDKDVWVKGTLILNKSDILNLTYILKNAEIIE